ncbi:MAG: PKD domain-containing protein [Bacteroidia bacterium]|nr:PKD domain-containing protein [Bacteroidia bacterium]
MKKFYWISALLIVLFASISFSQPGFVRGDFGMGWNDYQMTDRGVVKVVLIHADTTNPGAQFVFTQDLSYNPKWCGSTTDFQRAVNQYLLDASYYFTTGSWDHDLTVPILIGKYYTIITSKHATSNNDISILETDFQPVGIAAVSHTPAGNPAQGVPVIVSVTLTGPKNTAEKVFVRWSSDNWATSNFEEITSFDGNNQGTATIAGQSTGTTVYYYVLTTTQVTPSGSAIDFFTLNIGNNANMNYGYTVQCPSGCPFTISLGNDTAICGLGSIVLSPGVSVSPYGDSLIINYDASQGQTGLVGAAKVYMHSAAELHTNGGWQYVTGNWGQDDGIGQMTNIGGNTWRIKICPVDYFGYPADSGLNGILMVFRNADGTLTGKDYNGNDIWVNMKIDPPASSFTGITAQFFQNPIDSLVWSDGSHGHTFTATASGDYWVKVLNPSGGCEDADTVHITFGSIPYVNIGNDQGHCTGDSIVLNAGTGYTSYIWSTGAATPFITVDTTGTFSVTVTNNGCSGFDFVHLEFADPPVADFSYTVNGQSVSFTDLSQNGVNYYWDFNNNGTPESTVAGNVTWNYLLPGTYTVRLTVQNACDTSIKLETIVVTGVEENNTVENIRIYPNPATEFVYFDNFEMPSGDIEINVFDITGKMIFKDIIKQNMPVNRKEYDFSKFEKGVYVFRVISSKIYNKMFIKN